MEAIMKQELDATVRAYLNAVGNKDLD